VSKGHFHAVRFYDSEPALCRIVATFLREGLMLGQSALIIATPEHGQGIVAELRAHEMDVKALQAKRDLVVLDAAELMATFMVDGVPNRDKFCQTAEVALDRARRGRSNVTVRAYGEMVDVLWKEGLDVAAIQLEMLWNQLARTHQFSLLCGYAMGSFYKDAAVQDVCRQHTHLLSADGTASVSDADSLLLATVRQ
jgi:MEDS: MEthanogen/methylotroph, DcmR Sensory domain